MPRPVAKTISNSRPAVAPPVMLALLWIIAWLVIGVSLRWNSLDEPLWIDELHSAWCVADSWSDVAARAIAGNQSPLFFWLQFGVFHLFGGSELALRALPFAGSLLLLISIPYVVFRLSGSLAGACLALTLASLDDSFVFYAVEARPYGLVQGVAVWQAFFFIRWLAGNRDAAVSRRHRRTAGWLVFCSTLMFYLHLTTMLVLATQLVLLLAIALRDRWKPGDRDVLRRNFRRNLKRNGPVIGCQIVFCLPGIYLLAGIGRHRADWQAVAMVEPYGLLMVAHVLVYAAIGSLAAVCWRSKSAPDRPGNLAVLGWLAALVAVPVIFCLAGSVTRLAPLAHYRYSIASSTLLMVLCGVLIRWIDGPLRKFGAVVLTTLLATATNPLLPGLLSYGELPEQRGEYWKEAVAIVRSDDRPVVICPNLVEDRRFQAGERPDPATRNYYLFPVTGIYRLADPAMPEGGRLLIACTLHSDELLSQPDVVSIREQGGCWLLVRSRPADAEAVGRLLETQLTTPQTLIKFSRQQRAPVNLFRFDVSEKSTLVPGE